MSDLSNQLIAGIENLTLEDWNVGPWVVIIPAVYGISSISELDGATVLLPTGGFLEEGFDETFRALHLIYAPVPVESYEEAVQQFAASAGDILIIPRSALSVGELRSDLLVMPEQFDVIGNISTISLNLTGTADADLLVGMDGNDLIQGLSGNDTLHGNGGNDTIFGGGGFDTIEGGDGNDILDGGTYADRVNGGNGNDRLVGGSGFDLLYGAAGNDTLLGGTEPDRLFGGDGDDVLRAGTNIGFTVDGLFGEGGDDSLFGEGGFDLLDGGAGNDFLDGGAQADNLYGRDGADTLVGGDGFDRLFGGADDDVAWGGEGSDGIFGDQGNDTLYGEAGNDRFFGGTGNDLIDGGEGDDTVYGGAGFDTITGGTGNDMLFGLFNADTFVFVDGHGNDVIGDFEALSTFEKIDLSGVSAIVSLGDLNLGNAAGGAATQVGGDVIIDTGNGNNITLVGVNLSDLDSSDFLF